MTKISSLDGVFPSKDNAFPFATFWLVIISILTLIVLTICGALYTLLYDRKNKNRSKLRYKTSNGNRSIDSSE